MRQYAQYALKADDAISEPTEDNRIAVESALGILFEGRSSDFIGEYYSYDGADEETIKLTMNADPKTGEPWHEEYSDFQLLLDISTPRLEMLYRLLLERFPDIALIEQGDCSQFE